MESQIYYMSIPLKLEWSKANMINFLHYLSNVWSIKINWNDIVVYNDNFLNWTEYNSQYMDIESLKMQDYLDSNYSYDDNWDFLSYIKSTQWTEKFNIEITLNIYMKWVPWYKLQDFIKESYQSYNKFLSRVSLMLRKIDQRNPAMLDITNKLQRINSYLLSIKDITAINSKVGVLKDLELNYNLMYKYASNFSDIDSKIKQVEDTYNLIVNKK